MEVKTVVIRESGRNWEAPEEKRRNALLYSTEGQNTIGINKSPIFGDKR